MNKRPHRASAWSLHTRIGAMLALTTALLLSTLAVWWLHTTRIAIHEEVSAATRVSRQWLQAAIATDGKSPAASARLEALIRTAGRIRANDLEIFSANGERLYQAPRSQYKRDRTTPDWFYRLIDPRLPPEHLAAGTLTIRLTPDASRAIVDAWDDLKVVAGWSLLALLALIATVHIGLRNALRPLRLIIRALDKTDVATAAPRLPDFPVPEMQRLGDAFNAMSDRLRTSTEENIRLATEQSVARDKQKWLEAERASIARELHDELGQSITAIRAIAGALQHGGGADPLQARQAEAIITATGAMQDGIAAILSSLRTPPGALMQMLTQMLDQWAHMHPGIILHRDLRLDGIRCSEAVSLAVLRVTQEGLTNVVRHSGADRVTLQLAVETGQLVLELADNGRGDQGDQSVTRVGGFGLTGIRERMTALGGTLTTASAPDAGFRIRAAFPLTVAPTGEMH